MKKKKKAEPYKNPTTDEVVEYVSKGWHWCCACKTLFPPDQYSHFCKN